MSRFGALAERLALEVQKTSEDKVAHIRARLFLQQLAFIDDPCRFKSLLCARRAGKTFCVACYMLLVCLLQSDAEVAFIAVTKTHSKRIIWKTLKQLDKRFDLGIHFNNVELTATFPNGSMIGLHGAETEHDIEKFRGMAYALVVIDESASFPDQLLDYLYEEVLIPTLRDQLGTLVVAGTPGAVLAGTFYKATAPESHQIEVRDGKRRVRARPFDRADHVEYQDTTFEWSFHTWAIADNTAIPEMWERTLDDKDRLGLTDDDPRWLREGLARWITDTSGFVIAYSPQKNGWDPIPTKENPWGLPEGHEWHFVFGVDLGYDDDFDIEVFAFSDSNPHFFHVYGEASPGLTVTECQERIERAVKMFGQPMAIVCDSGGLGKQIIAEFKSHGLTIEAAQKQDKRDYIEIFNSDLRAGRCWIMSDSNLARQAQVAQWDEKKRGVDKRFADHAIDAAIYVRRFALHHFARMNEKKAPEPGSRAWYLEKELAERNALIEKRRKEQSMEWFDHVGIDDDPRAEFGLDDGGWN